MATAVEWALATRQKKRECESCAWGRSAKQGKACLRFIADVVEVRRAGKTDVAIKALVAKVHADYGYPHLVTALTRHVEKCLGYEWRRVYLAPR
jgi:hypothetical protein